MEKTEKEILESEMALEVEGSGCCTNPWKRKESWRKNWISHGEGIWLMHQSLGKCKSLEEKIGSVMEMSTFKAVWKSIIAVLARSIMHYMALISCNIQTYTYILKRVPIYHYTPTLVIVKHMLRKKLRISSIVEHWERVKRK